MKMHSPLMTRRLPALFAGVAVLALSQAAFAAEAADLVEHATAGRLEMFAVAQNRMVTGQQVVQNLLACLEGKVAHVAPCKSQQVENVIDERLGAAVLERGLQPGEI